MWTMHYITLQEAIELHPEPVEDEGFNLEGVLVRELVL